MAESATHLSPLTWLAALGQTAVAASKRPLGGILGPLEQVQPLKESLQIEAPNIKLEEPEKLYSLRLDDLLLPPKLQNGEWQGRRSTPADIPLINQWRHDTKDCVSQLLLNVIGNRRGDGRRPHQPGGVSHVAALC